MWRFFSVIIIERVSNVTGLKSIEWHQVLKHSCCEGSWEKSLCRVIRCADFTKDLLWFVYGFSLLPKASYAGSFPSQPTIPWQCKERRWGNYRCKVTGWQGMLLGRDQCNCSRNLIKMGFYKARLLWITDLCYSQCFPVIDCHIVIQTWGPLIQEELVVPLSFVYSASKAFN